MQRTRNGPDRSDTAPAGATRKARRLAGGLGLVAGCLLALGGCDALLKSASGTGQRASPYVDSVETLPNGFFRVWATVRVRATGEIVNIDYVVGCGGSVTNWTYTTPSAMFGLLPHLMLVATQSGELIGARTPEVCNESDWRPRQVSIEHFENGERVGSDLVVVHPVPDDFLPLLMWFPNADDLGFAIGYLSDKAYESPYSKLDLIDSGIARSSLEDWQAWRKKAADTYEQVGAMPGPWGMQFPGQLGSSPDEVERIRVLNGGRIPDVAGCYSLSLLDLPDVIRDDVLALLPENGRPWVPYGEIRKGWEDRGKAFFALLTKPGARFNGGSFSDHRAMVIEDGVRRSTGGGAFRHNSNGGHATGDYYHDRYPIAMFQIPEGDAYEPGARIHRALFDARWNGFGFCGKGAPSAADLTAYAEGSLKTIVPRYKDYDGFGPQWLMDGSDVMLTNVGYLEYNHIGFSYTDPIIRRDGKIVTECCTR